MLELFINKELITALPKRVNDKVIKKSHKLAFFDQCGQFYL